MAIFKKIAAGGKYQDDQAVPDLIAYITNPAKTSNDFINGVGVDGNDIAGSMVGICRQNDIKAMEAALFLQAVIHGKLINI